MESDPNVIMGVDIREGVPRPWLAQVFGLTQQTVRDKLANCPHRRVKGRGVFYDFKEACSYLAPYPAVSIHDYLATTDPDDLPISFQKVFWDTRKRRMEVELAAKELWHTEDVLEAFTDIFQVVKAAVQLWPDMIDRAVGVTGDQRDELIKLADSFQDDIHAKIIHICREKETKSVIEDIDKFLAKRGMFSKMSDFETGEIEDEDIVPDKSEDFDLDDLL